MKIAHIVCKFPPYKGGMGNSALHFAELSAENGNYVAVFTPFYGDKDRNLNIEIEKFGNFKVNRLRPLFKIGNAAIIPQLFLKLKSFDNFLRPPKIFPRVNFYPIRPAHISNFY